MLTAIDAWATRGPADDRTLDQRRADALVDICAYALDTTTNSDTDTATGTGGAVDGVGRLGDRPIVGTWQGRRPAVTVTVPLSSVIGGDTAAELAGFGPISADLAREIAFDPTAAWTICLVDDDGRLLHRGSKTYRPPAAMREFVITRDGVCAMPGCLRTARRCELDHITDWQFDGETSPDNLQPLCARHHHAKHDAGWQPERGSDGTTHWLSPRGQLYSKPAHALPTDVATTAHDLDAPPL